MIKAGLKRILALGIICCALSGMELTVYAVEKRTETEPNNTLETAELIEATSHSAADAIKGNSSNQHPKDGYTSINDEDWFKVYLNAGVQYVTCNGKTGENYNVEVYNSNSILIMSETFSRTGYGGRAYSFTATSSGYYYIKLKGNLTASTSYTIMVGGPIYTVGKCSVPLGRITMSDDNDEMFPFDISNSNKIPDQSIVYSMQVVDVSSYNINGISVRNVDTSRRLTLGMYTLDANNLVALNMPVLSEWEFTFGYKNDVAILPTVKFYYVYPLTSTYAEENVVIRP